MWRADDPEEKGRELTQEAVLSVPAAEQIVSVPVSPVEVGAGSRDGHARVIALPDISAASAEHG